MKQIICDKCGKVLAGFGGHKKVVLCGPSDRVVDLCNMCVADFDNWLKQKN
jgi:phage FluMu protein Com